LGMGEAVGSHELVPLEVAVAVQVAPDPAPFLRLRDLRQRAAPERPLREDRARDRDLTLQPKEGERVLVHPLHDQERLPADAAEGGRAEVVVVVVQPWVVRAAERVDRLGPPAPLRARGPLPPRHAPAVEAALLADGPGGLRHAVDAAVDPNLLRWAVVRDQQPPALAVDAEAGRDYARRQVDRLRERVPVAEVADDPVA